MNAPEPDVLLDLDTAALLLGVDHDEVIDRVRLWTCCDKTGEVLVPAFQIGDHGRLNTTIASAAEVLLDHASMPWVIAWFAAEVDGHARWTLAASDPDRLLDAAASTVWSLQDHPARRSR